jgi:hypothetical protein
MIKGAKGEKFKLTAKQSGSLFLLWSLAPALAIRQPSG